MRSREPDDVVDGQEIRLVAQLGDERELVLDQLADVGGKTRVGTGPDPGRTPIGVSPRQPFLDQLAQMRCRRLARGHDFLRVFVAQLVQRKRAALGDRDRFREQRRRIDRREPRPRAQVPLAVRVERVAALGERLFQADRGERVLQRAPGADMHVDVAGGNLRQAARPRQFGIAGEPHAIAGPGEQLDGDPRPIEETWRRPSAPWRAASDPIFRRAHFPASAWRRKRRPILPRVPTARGGPAPRRRHRHGRARNCPSSRCAGRASATATGCRSSRDRWRAARASRRRRA